MEGVAAPGPCHGSASKEYFLILNLKAAERAGNSDRRCMHTVMLQMLQMYMPRPPYIHMCLSIH